MKFLILTTPRAGTEPLEDRAATNRAAKAALEKWLADGALECAYQCLGGGGVAIASADSAEELLATIWSYPLHDQFEWHVEPVVDVLKAFEIGGG